jgi:tetratricopeptide (TPR) repeat protein
VNLKEITGQVLDLVQGQERQLRLRRRRARFGLAAALLGLLIQVASSANPGTIGTFVVDLRQLRFHEPQVLGTLVLLAGLCTYAVLRWTGFLVQESREAFRYTFRVFPFERVQDTPRDRFTLGGEDRFQLLAYDLMEELNQRVGRLSLLALDSAKDAPAASLDDDPGFVAHISIGGHYAIRERKDKSWVIQVMPQVQIGSARQPATLTRTVEYRLPKSALTSCQLEACDYNHILERVYSSVATEVYRQLKGDVESKMKLFPTHYLRAVALACEAEDFARSNTVDAYDPTIDLYKKSLRYFAVANVRPLTDRLSRWPLFWRKEIRFIHQLARVKTGYARALAHRFRLSGLSGLNHRALYEVPPMLEKVVESLQVLERRFSDGGAYSRRMATLAFLTFPEDTWSRYLGWRPGTDLFGQQRRLLFEANVVKALVYFYLGALRSATSSLDDARAVAPDLADGDPLYLLTKAEMEPALERSICMAERAVQLEPASQSANYLFAYRSEMHLRASGELTDERARPVIDAYDRVTSINPGNVAAIAARAYLNWLLEKNDDAERAFEEGTEVKEINKQTFLGEIHYGLARIAAGAGHFNVAHERYVDAMRADPRIAAYSVVAACSLLATDESPVTAPYYFYITPEILGRYERFRDAVLERAQRPSSSDPGEKCTAATRSAVIGFVQNDYGNACLNCYLRCGDHKALRDAVVAYGKASKGDGPTKAIALFNLAHARSHLAAAEGLPPSERQKEIVKSTETLALAEKVAPQWSFLLMAAVQSQVEAAGSTLDPKLAQSVVERLEKALRETRFGPLLDATVVDYEGGGVSAVLTGQVGPDRIERTDLDTLLLWARVLATNEKALGAARRLCTFLEGYYPENFQLRRTITCIERDAERCRSMKNEEMEIFKAWTAWFRKADPNNVTVLNRAKAFGLDVDAPA